MRPDIRWVVEPTVHADRKNIFAFAGEHGSYHVGTLVSGSRSQLDRFDADARLISLAPDHAMIGWAMCVQDARWEELGEGTGEFCFAGLRHLTSLDSFGCPMLTANLRRILTRAFADWQQRASVEAAA